MSRIYSLFQQGEVEVDNGSPCIDEAGATFLGLPRAYAHQSVFIMDTLHCKHCGGCVIKNPDRVRPRAHCTKCNWYMCDGCAYLASLPDYVHETLLEKADKMKTAAANLGEL